jgi:hypothetical protein
MTYMISVRATLRIHIIFLVKYLGVASVFFFKKEKSNYSGYSFDQLNKLVLFESY